MTRRTRIPIFSEYVAENDMSSFWKHPFVVKAISNASIDAMHEAACALGITPEMLHSRMTKKTPVEAKSGLMKAQELQPKRNSHRLERKWSSKTGAMTLDEYLVQNLGSSRDFWKEEFVLDKINSLIMNKVSWNMAADQLGVSEQRLRYRLAKKGLFKPKSKTKQLVKKKKAKKVGRKKVNLDGDVAECVESSYEALRKRNIEEKKLLFEQLGFANLKQSLKPKRGPKKGPRKAPPPPSKRSVRIERKQRQSIEAPQPSSPVPRVSGMDLDDFLAIGQNRPLCVKMMNDIASFDAKDFSASDDSASLILATPQVTSNRITSLDIHPQILMVGSACESGEVGFWAGDSGESFSLKPHFGRVNCIQFNPWNSSQVLTSGEDSCVRVLDLSRQKLDLVHAFEPGELPINWHLQISPSELLLSQGQNVYKSFSDGGNLSWFCSGNGGKIGVSSKSSYVLAVPQDNRVAILDQRMTKDPLNEIPLTGQPFSVSFSKEGES